MPAADEASSVSSTSASSSSSGCSRISFNPVTASERLVQKLGATKELTGVDAEAEELATYASRKPPVSIPTYTTLRDGQGRTVAWSVKPCDCRCTTTLSSLPMRSRKACSLALWPFSLLPLLPRGSRWRCTAVHVMPALAHASQGQVLLHLVLRRLHCSQLSCAAGTLILEAWPVGESGGSEKEAGNNEGTLLQPYQHIHVHATFADSWR